MSHHLRRRILHHAVKKGAVSPAGTTKELEIGVLPKHLSNVAYHFKVLAECGLLTLHHTAPKRGVLEHFYEPVSPAVRHPTIRVALENVEKGNYRHDEA